MVQAGPLTVLILGLGGNVSQGILKAVHMSKIPARVIGACVNPTSAGLFGVDRAYLSPYATDPLFVGWLLDVCRAESVDVVLSGVEAVLTVLSEQAEHLRGEVGAVTIVSSPHILQLAADKLATAKWLESNNFRGARGADVADRDAVQQLAADYGYPLLAKPRTGSGARGVFEIRHEEELALVQTLPGYMLQEVVGTPLTEYTVGSFSDRDGRLRGSIVMSRALTAGTSTRIEIGEFADVRAEAESIVRELRPVGPCNVQLRTGPEGPSCFEINARYSGTAPIRAYFGFNDVEAGLRHFVLGEPATDMAKITRGRAARYWNEVYLEPEGIARLEHDGTLDQPSLIATFAGELGARLPSQEAAVPSPGGELADD